MKKNRIDHSEGYIVKKVKDYAHSLGYLHRKVEYSNRDGAPDDWFFGYGADLIIIEFKASGKEPEPHQWREIRRLRKRGFRVFVVDNIEYGKLIFDVY